MRWANFAMDGNIFFAFCSFALAFSRLLWTLINAVQSTVTLYATARTSTNGYTPNFSQSNRQRCFFINWRKDAVFFLINKYCRVSAAFFTDVLRCVSLSVQLLAENEPWGDRAVISQYVHTVSSLLNAGLLQIWVMRMMLLLCETDSPLIWVLRSNSSVRIELLYSSTWV